MINQRSHEFNSRLMEAWRRSQRDMPALRCVMTIRSCVRFVVMDMTGAELQGAEKIRSDNDN